MYLPYDDAGEEEDKHDDDGSDYSAPQSEYENVCDRNIAEMQQKHQTTIFDNNICLCISLISHYLRLSLSTILYLVLICIYFVLRQC